MSMDYESLCKLISTVNNTPGFDGLVSNLSIIYIKDYINKINKKYQIGFDSRIIQFDRYKNKLFIGNIESPYWELNMTLNLKKSFEIFDVRKKEIEKYTKTAKDIFEDNLEKTNNLLSYLINKIINDKDLKLLFDNKYLKEPVLTKLYNNKNDIFTCTLEIDNADFSISFNLLKTYNEKKYKKDINELFDNIKPKLLLKVQNNLFSKAKNTGRLSRIDQSVIIDLVSYSKDKNIIKILLIKKRKLYKQDKEKLLKLAKEIITN